MVKRTLIAIAVVALLATTANALTQWDFPMDTGGLKSAAIKMDGKDNPTIRWPYTIVYDELPICTMPVKINVGMFVQIENCKDKKIVLEQVPCSSIGKGDKQYPCYSDCETFNARSNFPAEFGCSLASNDAGDAILGGWKCYYHGDTGNKIDALVGYQELKVCVDLWEAKLYNHAPGEDVTMGTLTITVKPQS